MAINPEADLAHWLQIFGPGRYEAPKLESNEESKLEKIEEIIQHEEKIDPQVRFFSQHLGSNEVKLHYMEVSE